MSLLQLFIQAIKGEPPPPPAEADGAIAIAATRITSCVLTVEPRGQLALAAAVQGRAALSAAPVNPG